MSEEMQMIVLPEADRSRSLMRAAEQQALYDLQTRMEGLDHLYCVQLAESESSLLVEIEDAIRSHAGSSAVTTSKARELLRAPLDALAGRVRGLLVKHGTDEAEAIKRALAGLASDLTAVQEQELRRLRESLNHAKRLAEAQNERIRRSMKTQLLQIRDNLRREYNKQVEEAQEKQREAETAAAAAAERHPTLDTQALLEERVALRLQVESLTKQLQEHERESKQTITHQSEARMEAERRAAFARRCLDEQTEKLTQVTDDLRAAILTGRRQSEEYATSQSALRQAQAQLESLRMKMMADREAQRVQGASSAPPPHQLGSLSRSSSSPLTISGNMKLNTALDIDWERLPESWREALLSLSDEEMQELSAGLHPPDTWPPELRELVLTAQLHPPSDSSAASSYLTYPPRLRSATASHPSSVLSHSARPSAGSARNAVSEVRAASVRAVSAPPCSAPARETPSCRRPSAGPYTAAGARDSAGTLRDRLRMVAESSPRGDAHAAQAAALSAKLLEMALEGVAVGSRGERSARSASHSFTPGAESLIGVVDGATTQTPARARYD
eukprot:jgi/Chrpa1/16470/Chrysochromulina_OHIO_Genome00023041-RA